MDRINKADTSATAEAFSLHAEEYDHWFDDPRGRILFDAEVKAIRLLMKNLSPPFLEIGVGSGRFARALGIRYGIDPSEALLEKARKRGIRAEKAFGEDMPFPDGIFGGIFILFTLCFVAAPMPVLTEARRVLKKGGGMILGIIDRESPWGKLYLTRKVEGHPLYQHANFFSIAEVTEMILTQGLTIEGYSSTLCNPPNEEAQEEVVSKGLAEGAGFVCILAKKS